jgi:Macrophage migration inhibitory factor (MIF)
MFETKRMTFGGTAEPAAYTSVASLGNVGPAVNPEVVKVVTGLLDKHCGVPADRCYVHVLDIPRGDFGWSSRIL